ncbi:MAG TPA: protein kinase, partial [Polyangiales bacterium]|nr:protein kinase [Polyangiales bacterium]
EIGEHDGTPFLAMELVEGSSLGALIAEGPLPAERAARYVAAVAESMHYAHERGVLHRDLKPLNILIDGNDQPRVTDFGLATCGDARLPSSASDAVVGTPSFMAPEQAAGARERMGPACDVYALGATLYACLTGRPPFLAETAVETLRQVIDAEPAPSRMLNRDVPRDLDRICLKCLAKDPGQRYPSAHELALDLGRFLRNEPVLARPVPWLRRLWLLGRRHPAAAALVIVTTALLAIMAGSAWLFRRDALDSNVQSAHLAARSLLAELAPLERAVERSALDPALLSSLERDDASAQHDALRRAFETHDLDGGGSRLRVRSFLLLDARGSALANWPPRERRMDDRSFRDYFRGAIRAAEERGAHAAPHAGAHAGARAGQRAYYSRVFRSLIDGYYNFGISRVVRSSAGAAIGVVVGLVGPASTDGMLGFSTPDRKTVLAARCDDPPPRQFAQRPLPRHVIMLHPAFAARAEAVAIEHPIATALLDRSGGEDAGRDGNYRDPVRAIEPRYAGSWLAGFARVSGTPFVVIFQTRDFVGDGLRLFGLVSLGGLAAWLLRLGWRRGRPLFRR